jgi:hypothetical protein
MEGDKLNGTRGLPGYGVKDWARRHNLGSGAGSHRIPVEAQASRASLLAYYGNAR